MMEPAVEASMRADIFVVVGTLPSVYPAAGLINYVDSGCRLFLIDPKSVRVPSALDVQVIRVGASGGMKELCKIL